MKKIISAALTPFTSKNEFDAQSAERMYDFNIDHQLDGFFLFGTMGEWALTTAEEKDIIAKHACGYVGDRAEVLLGIQDIGLYQMLSNMERWRDLTHDAWVFLFPGKWAAPACAVEYAHKIADAADRPVFLYYNPKFNDVVVSHSEFKEIFAHDNIVGVKNSASDMKIRKELLILKQKTDFQLFEGQEWAIDESLMLGCDGAVVGFGSCGARAFKLIASLVENGQFSEAQRIQARLIEVFEGVYGKDLEHVWGGHKTAMHHMGIFSSPFCRVEGQNELPQAEIDAVKKCVDDNSQLLR